MSQNEIKTVTRLYKYGVVFNLSIARNFQENAISELFKANCLWNRLVEIHWDHQSIFDQSRRDASDYYRKLGKEIDRLNDEIDTCYKVDLRKAHLTASERNKNHPINKLVHDKIKQLKAERSELYKAIKEPRKTATAEVDTSALDKAFWRDVKSACLIENNQIDSSIANEIQRYFKTARSKAFSDRATPRFHPFDGTGFWHWRLRLSSNYAGKKVTADGVKWSELFGKIENNKVASPLDKKRFLAAPATFISAVKNAADREAVPFVKVPPANTSKRNSACQKLNKKWEARKFGSVPLARSNMTAIKMPHQISRGRDLKSGMIRFRRKQEKVKIHTENYIFWLKNRHFHLS